MFVHVTNCIPIDYEYNMNIFLFRIKRCHKRKLIIVLLLVVHCFHFWSCPLLYHKQSYWHVGMEELQVPERYMYINIIVHILYWHGYMPPIPQRFACELRCTRASTVYIYIIWMRSLPVLSHHMR